MRPEKDLTTPVRKPSHRPPNLLLHTASTGSLQEEQSPSEADAKILAQKRRNNPCRALDTPLSAFPPSISAKTRAPADVSCWAAEMAVVQKAATSTLDFDMRGTYANNPGIQPRNEEVL